MSQSPMRAQQISTLDGVIGRIDDEMNDGPDAIAHLSDSRSVSVIRVNVIHDNVFGAGRQLAAAKKRVERIDQPRNAGARSVARSHPGADVNDESAAI